MKQTQNIIEEQKEKADVSLLWSLFKENLLTAVQKHVPHRTTSNRDRPPWITSNFKKLIKARYRSFKSIKLKSSNSKKEKLIPLKKTIHKETKAAYLKYIETILTEGNQTSRKKLWQFIKHRKTDSIDIAPLKQNDVLKDTPKEKAQILNDQSAQFLQTDSPKDCSDHSEWFSGCQYPNMGGAHVTAEEIEKLLSGLNAHKAMGPDGLHPRLLKKLSKTIAPVLQNHLRNQ